MWQNFVINFTDFSRKKLKDTRFYNEICELDYKVHPVSGYEHTTNFVRSTDIRIPTTGGKYCGMLWNRKNWKQ